MAFSLKAALTKSPEGGPGSGAMGFKRITNRLMKPTMMTNLLGKLHAG